MPKLRVASKYPGKRPSFARPGSIPDEPTIWPADSATPELLQLLNSAFRFLSSVC
jgi:hypothetical protein